MSKIILIQVFIFIGLTVQPQNYYLKSFNGEDGCPTSLVVSMVEDSLGYLWVGFSNKGLYRYDGYEFKEVEQPVLKTSIIEVYQSKSHEILIGAGNQTYILRSDSLTIHPNINGMMRSYAYLEDGSEYFGTETGRFIGTKNGSLMVNYSKSNQRIGQMSADSEGTIWFIGDNNEVCSYRDGKITNYTFGDNSKEQLWSVCVDDQDQVIASTLSEIKTLKNGKFVKWEPSGKLLKPFANYMFKDTRGRMWFLHFDAITIYDHGSIQYLHENNFKGMALATVYEDRYGGFWFGTTKGLLRLQNEFCILNPFNLKAEFMLKNIFQDSKGRIWTGSVMDGLVYWLNDKVQKVTLPSFDNIDFYNFFEDHEGKIWISTNNGIFIYYNNKVKHLKNGINVPNLPIYCTTQDGDHTMWSTTPLGIFRHTGDVYEFYDAKSLFEDPKNVSNLIQLYCDSKKRLWVMADNGLLLYESNSFKKFTLQSNSLRGRKWGMVDNNYGDLWIATQDSGVICFNPELKSIEYFGPDKGMLSNQIISISKDADGSIITGSLNGINKIVLDDRGKMASIISYTTDNGLIDDECLYKVLLCDRNHNIWFGSNAGLIKFTEPDHEQIAYSVPTYIECGQAVDETSRIRLKYRKNNIVFKATGINLSSPESIVYSYFLKGYDEQWSNPTSNRHISYSNLSPGEYELNVKTSVKDNPNWAGESSVSFIVETPFWYHWWFILLMISICALLIYFSLRYWAQNIRDKQIRNEQQKHKMIQLELKFLRSQMNPHFLFNSINSIQNLILNENIDQALNYLSDFGRLIRRVLNYSEKETVTIQEELDFLNEYLRLEKLRFKDKISVEILVDPELDKAYDRMPPMLIQPFVENAIKHGLLPKDTNGFLTVEFFAFDEKLRILITDNGVGRDHHKKNPNLESHQSKGIQIIADRINILRKKNNSSNEYLVEIKDLKDNFNHPIGTQVIIDVPIY